MRQEINLEPIPLLETGGMMRDGREWLQIDFSMGYDVNNDCSHAQANYTYGKESEAFYTGVLTRAYEQGWVSSNNIPETPYEIIIDDLLDRVTDPNVTITDIPKECNAPFKVIFRTLMESLRSNQSDVINQSIRLDLYDWRCQTLTLKTVN